MTTHHELTRSQNNFPADKLIHIIQEGLRGSQAGWRMTRGEPFTTDHHGFTVENLPFSTPLDTDDSATYNTWMQRPRIHNPQEHITAAGMKVSIVSVHPNTQIAAEEISGIVIDQGRGWTVSDFDPYGTYRTPETTFTRVQWNVGSRRVYVVMETDPMTSQIYSMRGMDATGKDLEYNKMQDTETLDVTRLLGQADHVLQMVFGAGYLVSAESVAGAHETSAA